MDSSGSIAAVVLSALFGLSLLWIGLFFFHKWIREQCRKLLKFLKDFEEYAKEKALRKEREQKETSISPRRRGRERGSERHRSGSRRYAERERDHSLEKGPRTPPPPTYPPRRNRPPTIESSVSQSPVTPPRPVFGHGNYPRAQNLAAPGVAAAGPSRWAAGNNFPQRPYAFNQMYQSPPPRPNFNPYSQPYATYNPLPVTSNAHPLQVPTGNALGYEQYTEEQTEPIPSKNEDTESSSPTEIIRQKKPEIINYRMAVDELPAFILEAESRLGLRSETEATVDDEEIQQIPRAYIPRSTPWVPSGPVPQGNWEIPFTSTRTTRPWVDRYGENRYAPYERIYGQKRKLRSADRRQPPRPNYDMPIPVMRGAMARRRNDPQPRPPPRAPSPPRPNYLSPKEYVVEHPTNNEPIGQSQDEHGHLSDHVASEVFNEATDMERDMMDGKPDGEPVEVEDEQEKCQEMQNDRSSAQGVGEIVEIEELVEIKKIEEVKASRAETNDGHTPSPPPTTLISSLHFTSPEPTVWSGSHSAALSGPGTATVSSPERLLTEGHSGVVSAGGESPSRPRMITPLSSEGRLIGENLAPSPGGQTLDGEPPRGFAKREGDEVGEPNDKGADVTVGDERATSAIVSTMDDPWETEDE